MILSHRFHRNKIFTILLGMFGIFALSTRIARAVCPICTLAVGAGLGLSRYLGVDDTVSGIWVGALLISSSLWMLTWMKSKNYSFPFKNSIIFGLFYGLTIIPLYATHIMGHPLNTFWGVDKLLFGIVVGTIGFASALACNAFVKKRNGGKIYFPFQKIAFSLAFLSALSGILYVIHLK